MGCLQDRLRRAVGVVPPWLIAVGPDQHRLASQWQPVGLVDRGIGTVHGGGGHHAAGDQGLRALLALDQDDVAGRTDARLVEQRARLRRGHLAALRVPRSEFLLASRWVIAVDDGDQLATGIEVVPLRRGRAEVVDRRFLLRLAHWHRPRPPEQIGSFIQHAREIGVDVRTEIGRDQGEDVAAIAGGTIRPQTGLLTFQHHLEAVTWTAQDVADQELATALLASRKHRGQHRLQTRKQVGANLVSFRFPVVLRRLGGVVEVDHSAPSTGASASWESRP